MGETFEQWGTRNLGPQVMGVNEDEWWKYRDCWNASRANQGDDMSAAVETEVCPRCGVQKPFHHDCEQTVDAVGGLSILVSGLSVVQAVPVDSTEPSPTEHFLTLTGQHEFSSTEYRFKLQDARRLVSLINQEIENLESD